MDQHGRVSWLDIRRKLSRPRACPKLKSYWHYHGCRPREVRERIRQRKGATRDLATFRVPRGGPVPLKGRSLKQFVRLKPGGLENRAQRGNLPTTRSQSGPLREFSVRAARFVLWAPQSRYRR